MDRLWTRAHDALLAEKCEGWTVRQWRGDYVYEFLHHERQRVYFHPLPDYTDISAIIRAAEAWRKQKLGRHYETRSAIADEFGERPENATLFHDLETVASSVYGDSALAWALWEVCQ